MHVLERIGERIAPFFIVLFMFFIPISPTAKSILLACSLIVLFLTPMYRNNLYYAYNTLWGYAAVAFFGFVVIACLWSPAPYSMQVAIIGKYCKIIYLPVLAVGFVNPKVRNWTLNAYLASVLVTCILSILKAHNIWSTGGDSGEIFYNHIITGFMVALGSYLAALFVFQSRGWLRFFYLLFILLTSYQVLFINPGKTGFILYFILMVLLFLQKLSFKKAVLGILLFSGVFTLAYQESHTMQVGIQGLIKEFELLQQNHKDTSLGYRIQFHHYASSLFHENRFIGIGTGGFKYRFAEENPIPSWGTVLSDPHGQYWMTLAEQGLIGLSLLLFFLVTLLITAFQLNETRPILIGMLMSFCIGSVSDTILCFSTAGYLLVVIGALCFGELIEKRMFKETMRSKSTSLGINREMLNSW